MAYFIVLKCQGITQSAIQCSQTWKPVVDLIGSIRFSFVVSDQTIWQSGHDGMQICFRNKKQ